VNSGTAPRFGYLGEYTDAESGLVYLRARYYDPSTGQFLSRDPITALTRQPYAYVGDDPLNSVDPSGLCNTASTTNVGLSALNVINPWCYVGPQPAQDILQPLTGNCASSKSLSGMVCQWLFAHPKVVVWGAQKFIAISPAGASIETGLSVAQACEDVQNGQNQAAAKQSFGLVRSIGFSAFKNWLKTGVE
jgi:RHS repeat-associated protein